METLLLNTTNNAIFRPVVEVMTTS